MISNARMERERLIFDFTCSCHEIWNLIRIKLTKSVDVMGMKPTYCTNINLVQIQHLFRYIRVNQEIDIPKTTFVVKSGESTMMKSGMIKFFPDNQNLIRNDLYLIYQKNPCEIKGDIIPMKLSVTAHAAPGIVTVVDNKVNYKNSSVCILENYSPYTLMTKVVTEILSELKSWEISPSGIYEKNIDVMYPVVNYINKIDGSIASISQEHPQINIFNMIVIGDNTIIQECIDKCIKEYENVLKSIKVNFATFNQVNYY